MFTLHAAITEMEPLLFWNGKYGHKIAVRIAGSQYVSSVSAITNAITASTNVQTKVWASEPHHVFPVLIWGQSTHTFPLKKKKSLMFEAFCLYYDSTVKSDRERIGERLGLRLGNDRRSERRPIYGCDAPPLPQAFPF